MDASLQNTVGPRYQLERLLGKGGMGSVYLARDTQLQRYVAIKTLTHQASSSGGLARFRAEAEVTARLQHPHIVQVYDVGQAPSVPYLVLEPLKGESLRSRLQREPIFSTQRACLVAVQVLSALAAAHKAGVVHRDIKPPNIFLVETPAPGVLVKVLDFGVARLASTSPRLTKAGELVGTIAYMAPEQYDGQEVDPRSDLYSLGMVLYEMLAGRRPFEGTSPEHVRIVMMSGTPPPFIPHCPKELNAVLCKALSRHPGDRFSSAHAMADALAPFLPRVTNLLAPITSVAQAPQPSVHAAAVSTTQGKPRMARVVLPIVGLLATSGAGFGLYQWLAHEPQSEDTDASAIVGTSPNRTVHDAESQAITQLVNPNASPSVSVNNRNPGAGTARSTSTPNASATSVPSGKASAAPTAVSTGTCLCIPPRTSPQGNFSLVPNYAGRTCTCSSHGTRLCASKMSCRDGGMCTLAESCPAKGITMNAPFEGNCSGWDTRGVQMQGKWECDGVGTARVYPGPSNTPCRGYQADGVLRDGVTDCL